jgi:hypothetical protein
MMIDLLAADVQRITARPLARALVGMFIMLIAVVGVIVFVRSAKHPFNPPVGFRNGLGGAATPLALAGFILGASLFGADYTTRALTTLLTWEPRRSRVLAAQAAASAAVTAGASLALLALLTIGLLPAALVHGTGTSPTASWYIWAAALAFRCALLAAAAAVIGTSFAALGRSTAAALAGAGVYVLVVEQAASNVAPSIGRWLVIPDAISWIAVTPNPTMAGPGGRTNGHTVITAGLLLLACVVVLHAVATTFLKHRDIT